MDRAILRRMPATFHIGLPNLEQRKNILRQILKLEFISDDVDFNRLATLTDSFSGSDLQEMCRTASVYRIRELVNENDENEDENLRPLSNEDLLKALGKMKESKVHCGSFSQYSPHLG